MILSLPISQGVWIGIIDIEASQGVTWYLLKNLASQDILAFRKEKIWDIKCRGIGFFVRPKGATDDDRISG